MWAYLELLRLYTNVWVEPINIDTLVVKGFVDESLASNGTVFIELREFNNKKKKMKKKKLIMEKLNIAQKVEI